METKTKQYSILAPFDYNSIKGDLFTLEQFLGYVDEGCFIPSDGHIGEVVIDGREVSINITKWGAKYKRQIVDFTLEELEKEFKGKKIEVVWYNK